MTPTPVAAPAADAVDAAVDLSSEAAVDAPMVEAAVDLPSDADAGLRLTAYLFEQLFKRRPTLLTMGAGGLTLFGRPGDRFALAIPVRWGATVAAGPRDDGMVDLRSGSHAGKELIRPVGALGDLPEWAVRPLAVVASAVATGEPVGGMSLLVGTALPEGAGMQSDVALTSLLATALAALFGVELSLAQRARLGDLPAQLAALSCPDDTAMLVDTQQMTAEQVPFDLYGAGLRLMLIDLGAPVASVASGPGDLALAAVDRLRTGNLMALGPLFSQATELVADPHGVVAAVAGAASSAGALGFGTLPGGCLMALVPVSRLSPVRSAVSAAWPGARVPKFLTAMSSRGGRDLLPTPS